MSGSNSGSNSEIHIDTDTSDLTSTSSLLTMHLAMLAGNGDADILEAKRILEWQQLPVLPLQRHGNKNVKFLAKFYWLCQEVQLQEHSPSIHLL